jgi:hypothetical protein
MAATDQRQSRARAREERRGAAAKRTSEQSQAKEEQQSMQDDSGSNNGEDEGHKGRSTAKLVLAGAAVGALLGTVKSVAGKRRGGSQDEAAQEANGSKSPPTSEGSKKETPSTKQGSKSGGEGPAAGQSSLRGMAVSVLEAAVEGLKNPPESQATADTEEDDGPAEHSSDDEDDEEDEEADRMPHGEGSENDDSSPRGSAEQTQRDDDEREEEDEEHQTGSAEAGEDDDEAPEHEDDETDDARGERSHPSDDSAGTNGHSDGANLEIVRQAVSQMAELIGRRPESVSGFERRDDGLHLAVEVVELERIPHSTDVIASYDVAVDDDGSVLEYARTRRYYRNRAEEEF